MISPAQHLEVAPALIAAQLCGGPHFAPGAGVQTRTRANAKGPTASLQVDHSPVRRNQRLLIGGMDLVTLVNKLLRSEEHTSELQSRGHLVCRLLLEKKKRN